LCCDRAPRPRLTVEAPTFERPMLHPFVSSRAVRTSWRAGTTFSVTLHAGLIAAAVAASTGRSGTRPHDMQPVSTERVVYSELPHSERIASPTPARHRRNAVARRQARGHRSALRLVFPDPSALRLASVVQLDVSSVIPDVSIAELDFASLRDEPIEFGAAGAGGVLRLALGLAYAAPTANGAYSVEVVEKIVAPRRGNPKPTYPPRLLHAGIEAGFLVQFVVDSTGRVDAKSIEFPATAHPLFAQAVQSALQRSRYFPAELGGRRVSQVVAQHFKFILNR
jgi:TonB family protein